MREEWNPIPSGTPVLRLWSEGDRDEQLTRVEKALLRATLARASQQNSALAAQVELARCTEREFAGYGVFLHLALPAEAPRAEFAERVVGGAFINWANGQRANLMTISFVDNGRLCMLEVFPCDGEGWSANECRRILAADLSSVVIAEE